MTDDGHMAAPDGEQSGGKGVALLIGIVALALAVLVPIAILVTALASHMPERRARRLARAFDETATMVIQGDAQGVGRAIERRPALAAHANEDGNTLLHFAAASPSPAVVKVLLAAGADVNAIEAEGFTPLHMAIAWGHIDTVRLLAGHGADLDARADNGSTALRLAAASVSTREAAVFLIDSGADYDILSAAALGDLTRLRELLDADAGLIAVADGDGHTAIHYAAMGASAAAAGLLMARGAESDILVLVGLGDVTTVRAYLADDPAAIDTRDSAGFSLLHWAVASGQLDMADVLITEGADLEARARRGKTPLHLAAYEGREEMADLLLSRGADIAAATDSGWPAWGIAHKRGHLSLAARLH